MCGPRLHRFPRAIRAHKQSRDAMLAKKICARSRTEDECDFCRYLCLFAPVCHDGDRPEIALGWLASTRVEYVVLQRVVLPPVAMSNAGSCDGPGNQWDRPDRKS